MGKLIVRVVAAVLPIGLCTACDMRPAATERPRDDKGDFCPNDPSSKVRATLQFLHRANEAQMRVGNLAASRARLDDVREFAGRLVVEHGAADQKLTDLARREHIDLTFVLPADPIHLAADRLAVEDERALDALSTPAFELAFVASQATQQGVAQWVGEEGQKSASGEIRSLFADAHEMAVRHRDKALALMQDYRFEPRAIGGGPKEDER